ncbi:hypothetical protein [Ferrimicrobium sp.]|uniref:hypothetical protein n=1 Tax=Ferrimicrobium sp. TaxID=2926050 RepID=UPI0026144E23|nr:hypothetical protein [Ferrimicrobium sp.]
MARARGCLHASATRLRQRGSAPPRHAFRADGLLFRADGLLVAPVVAVAAHPTTEVLCAHRTRHPAALLEVGQSAANVATK